MKELLAADHYERAGKICCWWLQSERRERLRQLGGGFVPRAVPRSAFAHCTPGDARWAIVQTAEIGC